MLLSHIDERERIFTRAIPDSCGLGREYPWIAEGVSGFTGNGSACRYAPDMDMRMRKWRATFRGSMRIMAIPTLDTR